MICLPPGMVWGAEAVCDDRGAEGVLKSYHCDLTPGLAPDAAHGGPTPPWAMGMMFDLTLVRFGFCFPLDAVPGAVPVPGAVCIRAEHLALVVFRQCTDSHIRVRQMDHNAHCTLCRKMPTTHYVQVYVILHCIQST